MSSFMTARPGRLSGSASTPPAIRATTAALGDYYTEISADGRFVAFYSDAGNLVAGDTNESGDIFVHDRKTGATERVSVDSAGNQGNGGSAADPAISPNGRFVAFWSIANNLVPGDRNRDFDVFVHDRKARVAENERGDLSGE